MRDVVASIEGEFRRYRKTAEEALAQVAEPDLVAARSTQDNSIATIARHVGGNLRSRFTDFLTTDGEKPWRDRDGELAPRVVSRAEMMEIWNGGWGVLEATMATLDDGHLGGTITIRGQAMSVTQALHRALAHVAYHVGQIVFVAKSLRGEAWHWLSVAPGRTAEYNAKPDKELPPGSTAPTR